EEQERLAAEEEARRQKAAEEEAAARVEQRIARLTAFEKEHPVPEAGLPQATVRFRAASGATIQRAFSESTEVSALFEFVAVAEWDGPTLGRRFDLRTSFPVTNLQGKESQTLRQHRSRRTTGHLFPRYGEKTGKRFSAVNMKPAIQKEWLSALLNS
ncbi:unnamed protein product, partial [Symbiodinium pilosum]